MLQAVKPLALKRAPKCSLVISELWDITSHDEPGKRSLRLYAANAPVIVISIFALYKNDHSLLNSEWR